MIRNRKGVYRNNGIVKLILREMEIETEIEMKMNLNFHLRKFVSGLAWFTK